MSNQRFSPEFKDEAVRQIIDLSFQGRFCELFDQWTKHTVFFKRQPRKRTLGVWKIWRMKNSNTPVNSIN